MDSEYTAEIAAGLEIWRDRLGCEVGEPAGDAGDERVARAEATCRDGSEVVEYRIEGMGHVWPRESHGIDATQVMWEFFTAHAR
jgi:polyhydroxybutyrate depolymerase